MFEGFTEEQVRVGDASTTFVRHGGAGPPVLLLHGHPRTSATWHRVAPQLVGRGFTVVCPDLRGYGRSRGPAPTPDHGPYAKHALAADLASLMRSLGHDRYAVAGHDRGGLVALRLALDHPRAVSRVAFLDCAPITEQLARINTRFATLYWHWFFFAQPDVPERVIGADPDAWYHGDPEKMGEQNYDEWRQATRDPRVIRTMLEDYRAGLSVDVQREQADRAAGVRVRCPALMLWSEQDDLPDLHDDPLALWRSWTTDLQGYGIDCDHHMAEEAPDALADALTRFLDQDRPTRRTAVQPAV
jgi:haloacetate dehalogenase